MVCVPRIQSRRCSELQMYLVCSNNPITRNWALTQILHDSLQFVYFSCFPPSTSQNLEELVAWFLVSLKKCQKTGGILWLFVDATDFMRISGILTFAYHALFFFFEQNKISRIICELRAVCWAVCQGKCHRITFGVLSGSRAETGPQDSSLWEDTGSWSPTSLASGMPPCQKNISVRGFSCMKVSDNLGSEARIASWRAHRCLSVGVGGCCWMHICNEQTCVDTIHEILLLCCHDEVSSKAAAWKHLGCGKSWICCAKYC